MDDDHDAPTLILDDAVLLELAEELHRLAVGLKRDLRRSAVLPGLSDLTAMRPLQAMLTEALSARVGRAVRPTPPAGRSEEDSIEIPGYL